MNKTNEDASLKNVKTRLLTLVTAAIILVCALAVTASSNKKHLGSVFNGTTNVLGVSTEAKDSTLSINKVTTTSDARTTASMMRVIVSITLKNTAGRQLLVSPGEQMTLVDKDGGAYQMTAGYNPGRVIGGTLEAGQTFTGDIDFEIPTNKTPAQFIYQENANSVASIVNL
jgi:hypothetical protein